MQRGKERPREILCLFVYAQMPTTFRAGRGRSEEPRTLSTACLFEWQEPKHMGHPSLPVQKDEREAALEGSSRQDLNQHYCVGFRLPKQQFNPLHCSVSSPKKKGTGVNRVDKKGVKSGSNLKVHH